MTFSRSHRDFCLVARFKAGTSVSHSCILSVKFHHIHHLFRVRGWIAWAHPVPFPLPLFLFPLLSPSPPFLPLLLSSSPPSHPLLLLFLSFFLLSLLLLLPLLLLLLLCDKNPHEIQSKFKISLVLRKSPCN